MKEVFLSVSWVGKGAKSVLTYKVVAKGELKKQVVRFLLFL
jgi:hypothetical protein